MPNKKRAASKEKEEEWARKLPWILPLASGIFFGASIFEMMPDALEKIGSISWIFFLGGIILFILVKDGLDYIGRQGLAGVATFGIWLHSFLEGVVTGTSYSVSLLIGLLVSAGMILHLIPEIGAVFVLLSIAGVSRKQSLIRNGITWIILILGFLVAFFFFRDLNPFILGAMLAFGAGGFVYLSYLSWKEHKWNFSLSILVAALGASIVALMKFIKF